MTGMFILHSGISAFVNDTRNKHKSATQREANKTKSSWCKCETDSSADTASACSHWLKFKAFTVELRISRLTQLDITDRVTRHRQSKTTYPDWVTNTWGSHQVMKTWNISTFFCFQDMLRVSGALGGLPPVFTLQNLGHSREQQS